MMQTSEIRSLAESSLGHSTLSHNQHSKPAFLMSQHVKEEVDEDCDE